MPAAPPRPPVLGISDALVQLAALIREARRRARRRRFGYAALALVVAASVVGVLAATHHGGGVAGGRGNEQPSLRLARTRHANGLLAFSAMNTLSVVKPNGADLRVLTRCPGPTDDCSFAWYAWSPDGRRLAFLSGHLGGAVTRSNLSLYVINADGTGRRLITRCGECSSWKSISWAPGGKRIALAVFDRVRVVSVADGSRGDLDVLGVSPAWSPDGKRIAYAFSNGLYTVALDGSKPALIARVGDASTDVADPAWSPDGRKVAFDDGDSVYTVGADGSDLTLIKRGLVGEGPAFPSWSPDGRRLLYFDTPRDGDGFGAEVWLASADGGNAKRIYRTRCCVGVWNPATWSPDGTEIAFSDNAPGGVLLMDMRGRHRRTPVWSATPIAWQPLPWRR